MQSVWVTPLYLQSDTAERYRITHDEAEQTEGYIRESYQHMRSLVSDPGKNVADIVNFPPTDGRWLCQSRDFKELCQKELAPQRAQTPS